MKYRTRNIITGILFIALAVCLIMWKLNVLNLPPLLTGISIWGLVIAVLMAVVIVHSILYLSFGGIFIPLAVIAIIFDKPLGITAITPWVVLIAAVLLTIAFHLIFPHHKRNHVNSHGMHGFKHVADRFSDNFSENENGSVYYSIQFGSSTRYVRSENLTSASLSCQFGEMNVFFDKARVSGNSVNIDCSVSFGKINVYVPQSWMIENRVGVTLGDCDIKGLNPDNTAETVTCFLSGSVTFGDLNLIRV